MADDARHPKSAVDAYALPIEEIDVSKLELWRTNTHWPYFARLRREDPVHYCRDSQFGPYWSVTMFNDIMTVETNHEVFSSEVGHFGISIYDEGVGDAPTLPMFIAMDPPKARPPAQGGLADRRASQPGADGAI